MAKNENQQTTGYKKKMEENRELLRQIGEKLNALDESQAKHPGVCASPSKCPTH